jgi:hypothetical protein
MLLSAACRIMVRGRALLSFGVGGEGVVGLSDGCVARGLGSLSCGRTRQRIPHKVLIESLVCYRQLKTPGRVASDRPTYRDSTRDETRLTLLSRRLARPLTHSNLFLLHQSCEKKLQHGQQHSARRTSLCLPSCPQSCAASEQTFPPHTLRWRWKPIFR